LIDLDAAIRELPPRTRMAVVLVCIEGYSHGAAAAMMGTAEGTVKAQVHKGRQLLRERLER
jgi:RNA polymerase sigma-70 factor (ECF subfamily)